MYLLQDSISIFINRVVIFYIIFLSNSKKSESTLSVIKIFMLYRISSAIEKYINNPMTSFIVVIKGPVARAGSILYLFNNKGIKVPNKAANTITVSSETLTIKGIFGWG